MHKKKQIVDFAESAGIEVLLLPSEYDKAIVGLGLKFNEYSVVYNAAKCISVLVKTHGMTYEEAVEYFEFNIEGSYLGVNTPTFIVDIPM
jgi:hypothetical protein